ncbi:D,D-heptose 1,7-bisphosphate phosphatase [bacterium]|nr:D,D-heptose 1,7-bisphosphate phosphatase [bacterium]|tara:strand:- start:150 stop:683 length:534 start_codon:yes stop_codon:yes gene_type:complete
MNKTSRAIFLDRDGTINVDDDSISNIDNWVFCDKAPEALKMLQDAGYKLIVITNQGGIDAGKYTLEDMQRVHAHMHAELAKSGVKLDAVAYCPHIDECECRKPKAGMLDQVRDLIADVDMSQSWMIGDKEADVGFGKKAKVQTALIPSRYWDKERLLIEPDLYVDSLYEFAQQITSK